MSTDPGGTAVTDPIGNNPSPFQELDVTEIRYGVELLAFQRPDSLQMVVDGAPPELKVTVNELAFFVARPRADEDLRRPPRSARAFRQARGTHGRGEELMTTSHIGGVEFLAELVEWAFADAEALGEWRAFVSEVEVEGWLDTLSPDDGCRVALSAVEDLGFVPDGSHLLRRRADLIRAGDGEADDRDAVAAVLETIAKRVGKAAPAEMR